jgi:hypothetical protein
MNKVLISLVFGISIISASAWADDDCSPVRMDQPSADGTPGSMQNVAMRNQRDWGVCYSETAAELVDSYRFSRLLDPRTELESSEMSAVFELNPPLTNDPVGTPGVECQAVEMMRTEGFNDRFDEIECVLKKETPAAIAAIQPIFTKYQAIQKANSGSLMAASLTALTAELAAAGIPAPDMPSQASLQDLMGLDFSNFLWGLEVYECVQENPVYHVSMPSCMNTAPLNDQDYIKLWTSKLNEKNPLPLSVEFCIGAIWDGRSYPGPASATTRYICPADSVGDTSGHAVLIIGRRKNKDTGKCQVLVRNSWGTDCLQSQRTTHPPGLAPKQKQIIPLQPNGQPYRDSFYAPEWECDKGNVWMDQDTLAKSAFSLSWIGQSK